LTPFQGVQAVFDERLSIHAWRLGLHEPCGLSDRMTGIDALAEDERLDDWPSDESMLLARLRAILVEIERECRKPR